MCINLDKIVYSSNNLGSHRQSHKSLKLPIQFAFKCFPYLKQNLQDISSCTFQQHISTTKLGHCPEHVQHIPQIASE